MDRRLNPYAPGAGNPPPELAGRDVLIERAAVALDRIRDGRSARSLVLYGLRGVGKTVLLNKIRSDAEARNIISVQIEAPEARSLPAVLVPSLRAALTRMGNAGASRQRFEPAWHALVGFARALKFKYHDIEVGFEPAATGGIADSGDLEYDLKALFQTIGQAAKAEGKAVAIYVDELQYVPEPQMSALIMALHAMSQESLPFAMVAAGLPQLLGQMGSAKSYAERLFEFVEIDALCYEAALTAVQLPAMREGVMFTTAALDEIVAQTKGYPYFLQEWGRQSWDHATQSPIGLADVKVASANALSELDASFFRVRFDRLTPSERRYVVAMADLGPGPHRSGEIADKLGRAITNVAPTRASLIKKGMVYSRAHGETAFTVPLFDGFIHRTIA